MKLSFSSPPTVRLPEGSAAWPEPVAVAVPVACRLLGIGRTKLYELLGDGTLASVKLGRRCLVRLDTVRKLLAALERPGIARDVV